tara:strand:+ start:182 stop:340 length:159 start_codon:yes stop_codon:yes gene_type:complete
MNLFRPHLLAAGLAASLALTACSDPEPQGPTGDPSIQPEQLTVLVVEASGGG